jgi:glycosyltransferase involved in cell wall biosynthesis
MPALARIQAHHERRALRHARHLTVESPWGKDQLNPLAPRAVIDLLEYGVDPACFDIQRQPDDSPTALFVGSTTRLKGVDTLLKAFADPRLRHVKLVVLGAISPDLTSEPLPRSIKFLGHVPSSDVRAWMSRAWCLVHPTRADTSPNSVKEARVIGLPVVTTPNGGQIQYVKHLASGFIHPANDVEGLIRGVLAVTADQESNRRMGATGQAECRGALLPGASAKRLCEIYRCLNP